MLLTEDARLVTLDADEADVAYAVPLKARSSSEGRRTSITGGSRVDRERVLDLVGFLDGVGLRERERPKPPSIVEKGESSRGISGV